MHPCGLLITGDAYAAAAAAVGTDFRQWSKAEVRAFLDQRGEDFDDCQDFDALVSWLLCEQGAAGSKFSVVGPAGNGPG